MHIRRTISGAVVALMIGRDQAAFAQAAPAQSVGPAQTGPVLALAHEPQPAGAALARGASATALAVPVLIPDSASGRAMRSRVWRGAVIGAVVGGAALGFFALQLRENDTISEALRKRETWEVTSVGVGGGALLGAGIGALLGRR